MLHRLCTITQGSLQTSRPQCTKASSEEVNDWILAEDYRFGGKTRSRLSSKPGRMQWQFRLWVHRYLASWDLLHLWLKVADLRSLGSTVLNWGIYWGFIAYKAKKVRGLECRVPRIPNPCQSLQPKSPHPPSPAQGVA